MYCNIEQSFLGKKLDKMFTEQNRNLISNLIENEEFNKWFGEGRKDTEGNPVIDDSLSFTNGKGEKKTVFDFPPVHLRSKGEVFKLLKSSPGVHLYNSELFVNNTEKNSSGEYSAKSANRLINVLNWYYPGVVSVDIYKRKGLSTFSKDQGIPLPIIRINDVSLNKPPVLFSIHDANRINLNDGQFNQIRSVDELVAIQNAIDEFRVYGVTEAELQDTVRKPAVSEETYAKLEEFFKKLSPDAKVEVKDLSTAGAAYIRDFLIQLDTSSKYTAMPEEVSHFFFEMLPLNSSLRKDMMDNITSFLIYRTTLATYKDNPAYQRSDGSVNYDKIKREASAKLIGEYVYAQAEGDFTRINTLLSTNDSFIKRWWDSFVNWLANAFGIKRKERFQSYIDAADAILNQNVEWLSKEEIFKNSQNDVFFLLTDRNKIDIEMAKHILENVAQHGKIEDLQGVIDKFRQELGKNLIKITGQEGFETLNYELSKDSKGKPGDINYLSELYDIVKKVDITGHKLSNLISSDNQILNFSEFIRVIQNMENVAKAINTLVDAYTNSGKMESISELQSFRNIYSNFQSFINDDLATILAQSDIGFEFVNRIRETAVAFSTVEFKIIAKLRESYKTFLKDTLAPDNEVILNTFTKDVHDALYYRVKDTSLQASITEAIDQLKADIRGGMDVSTSVSTAGVRTVGAKERFIEKLEEKNIPKDILNSAVISQQLDKIDELYTTDRIINEFMNGLGHDIDLTSQAMHLMSAGIKNHDVFVANVSKFIVNRRSQAENIANIAIKEYMSKVSPIITKMKALGLDEYQAGEAITYIDQVNDYTKNKKNTDYKYKDHKRDIVRLLSPTLNSAIVEKERLLKVKNDLLRQWKSSDPNSEEGKKLKTDLKQARKEYINFDEQYFNSRFNEELTAFQKKWNNNEEFLEIKEEWDIITEQMRILQKISESNPNNNQAFAEYQIKRRERNFLLKQEGVSEEHAKAAKLLQDFFDESSKFREEDVRRTKRNYIQAYRNYEGKVDYALSVFLRKGQDKSDLDNLEQTLQDVMKDSTIRIKYKYKFETADQDNVSHDSVSTDLEVAFVKAILMGNFEDRNKIKVKTDYYYEFQDQIFEQIERLKAEQGLSEVDLLVADIYKQINDILKGKGDFYGQRNPDNLTADEVNTLDTLENRLNTIKSYNIRTYKIMDDVKDKKSNAQFLPLIAEYEKLVSNFTEAILGRKAADEADLAEYKKDISDYNKLFEQSKIITDEQKKIAKDISDFYKILSTLADKTPTESYWDKIEDIIPAMEKLLEDKQAEKLANPNLSKAAALRLDAEIRNLAILIHGEKVSTGEYTTGGLMAAIYERNYEMLDKLINDEYYADNGDTLIEFLKYVNINVLTDSAPIEGINPDFFDWFTRSHRMGNVWVNDTDPFTGKTLQSGYYQERPYVRRLYYTYTEPMVEEHDGKKLFELKENSRYRATKISDAFLKKQVSWKDTNDMEDWTVDNRAGRPQTLPLSRKQLAEQGKTDTKYLNKEYYRMKDSTAETDKLLFQYLNESISTYFTEQENKPDELKTMFNLPVTNLDHYQKTKQDITLSKDRARRLYQKFMGMFTSTDTDEEDQLTGVDQITDTDQYTQEIIESKVPRLGMSVKLVSNRVNRNVLHAIQQYIVRSKDFDTRSDLNPFVKGLLDVLKENEKLSGHQNQKKRAAILDQIYKQMILEEMPNNVTNQKFFRKTANILMSMTGVKLMADVVGGSINYLQANINNIIEAFAGKYVTPTNYAVGYSKASSMIAEFLADFNKKSDFGYWVLMYQSFDFIQGEWIEDVTERASTKNKAFDWRKFAMYPRKNGELHAQSAMAIGILDNTKIKNSIDDKEYPMWNIYKKEGDTLVLKEGFDPALYNTTDGTEYQRIKNLIHSVNIDLHGNYAKINQTEASRHSIGKLMENMKRWFISNFQRRFGREGVDVNKSALDQGYYNTPALALANIVNQWRKGNTKAAKDWAHFYLTTPRKRENLKRFAADVTLTAILFMTTTFLFGYDYDDPDKNKKLRASSWLYNEALLVFLRTYAEHTAFIPVPPFGFTELTRNLLDPFSVAKSALGNAAGAVSTLAFSIGYYIFGIDALQNDAVYQKDSGAGKGPTFPWFWDIVPGEKGESKFLAYLAKVFGYNGAQIDPANYIKNFEQLQNRLK